MRIIRVFMVLFPLAALCAVPFGAALAGKEPKGKVEAVSEAGRCEMSMNIGWFARQDVSIKPGRVVGPDFNLHIEDDVIYGFIRGKATRFKVGSEDISGSAAGYDLMLHISKSDIETEVCGLVGRRRVVAKVSSEKISVSGAAYSVGSSASSLAVSMIKAGYYRGQVGGGPDMQLADMTLNGCDLTFLRDRPGLIVALFMAWLGA